MSGGVRCFVAVEVAPDVREAIAAHFAREGRWCPGVAWVRAPNLHLTLKFLGPVNPARLAAVQAAVVAASAGHAPFALALRGAGAFPSAERPRVLWVGVAAGAAELSALAAAVEGGLAPLGFAPEGRPYSAHLTVGRVKTPPRDRACLPRLLEAVRARAWGEWVVPAVHLVRSELFPAGPIYSILQTTRLPESSRQDR